MDCKFGFDLSPKGHRKDSDKARNRKDDDSLAEPSHSKKTVKKAGNGLNSSSAVGSGAQLLFLSLELTFFPGEFVPLCHPQPL